jgi:hypothetical protein
MIENAGLSSRAAGSGGMRSAAAVIVVSALSAPWIFRLVHPRITGVPFRRVFDRVLLVVALAGFWPALVLA